MLDLDAIRTDYLSGELNEKNIKNDPFEQFELWMGDVIKAELPDPTATVLATVDEHGQPSQRIVLLKKLSRDGFVFFTNYSSNKAQHISVNECVSLHFPWHLLERQVIVKGKAKKISKQQTLDYFLSRPRDSQIGAWASQQSRPISSRQLLMQQFESMKAKFGKGEVPLPDFWGGYIVEPSSIEFWQGRGSRLHDRFIFSKTLHGWEKGRFQP